MSHDSNVRDHLDATRLPLLITGVTGVAGSNALAHFRQVFPGQVVGLRPVASWQMAASDVVGIEQDDADAMASLFDQYRFGSVLDCAGNCALRACELNPAMARRINVAGTRVVLDQAMRVGARFIHLSCDLVFSGAGQGGHIETDIADPVTIYGKTMIEAENLIRESGYPALALRISLPMGESFNGHAGAIDWIESRFRRGLPATLYFDEIRTPTYCDDMNAAFAHLLASDLTGLFHFGGPRSLSLYQIAQIVNRVGGYAPELLRGCPRIEAGPMPPRAGNVSMDSSKLERATGQQFFRPWPVSDELTPDNREWHHRRDGAFIGHPREIRRLLYRC